MLRAPAGKTTLMDCLAGRKTTGLITGDVRVAGYPKVQQTFARVMGYVEQVCHFFLSGASLMGHHAADANSAARAGKTQCPYGGSYACMACRLPIPPTPACQQALSSRPKLPNSISCVCFLPAERHPQQQHHGAGEPGVLRAAALHERGQAQHSLRLRTRGLLTTVPRCSFSHARC